MKDESSQITYDLKLLEGSRRSWEASSGLRCLYGDIYHAVRAHCVAGPTLEIGSGIGVSREFFENVVTSDVVKTPYVDGAMSAYAIEASEQGDWANIFAIDVLHHLMQPMRFFESAARALRPGGRLILAEPAATLGGRLFYRLCHHEPIRPDLVVPPFEFAPSGAAGEFANMGMGVGLVERHRQGFDALLEPMGLELDECYYRDFAAYPATGGYSRAQLLPTCLLKTLLAIEKRLPQWFLRRMGLRMLIILRKKMP